MDFNVLGMHAQQESSRKVFFSRTQIQIGNREGGVASREEFEKYGRLLMEQESRA